MVSWVESFKRALFTVGFSIAFSILGLVILFFGTTASVSFVPETYTFDTNWLIFIPSFIIGVGLIGLGTLASVYKFLIEFIQDEIGGVPGGLPGTPKICPNCGTHNRPQARICRNCGSHLS